MLEIIIELNLQGRRAVTSHWSAESMRTLRSSAWTPFTPPSSSLRYSTSISLLPPSVSSSAEFVARNQPCCAYRFPTSIPPNLLAVEISVEIHRSMLASVDVQRLENDQGFEFHFMRSFSPESSIIFDKSIC